MSSPADPDNREPCSADCGLSRKIYCLPRSNLVFVPVCLSRKLSETKKIGFQPKVEIFCRERSGRPPLEWTNHGSEMNILAQRERKRILILQAFSDIIEQILRRKMEGMENSRSN